MNLGNTPQPFPFGGSVLRLRRVSTLLWQSTAEAYWLERELDRIRAEAGAFPNPLDGVAHVRQRIAALPTGDKLAVVAVEKDIRHDARFNLRLLRVACVDQVDDEDLAAAADRATLTECTAALSYVVAAGTEPIRRAHSDPLFRELAKQTGYTPDQIMSMADDEILNVLGLADQARRERAIQQAETERDRQIAAATERWNREHPGVVPDLIRDILPLVLAGEGPDNGS
jgi:hypothetical protein